MGLRPLKLAEHWRSALSRVFIRRQAMDHGAGLTPGLCSEPEEERLLDALIRDGWEQGCWVEGTVATHALAPAELRRLMDACSSRDKIHREQAFIDHDLEIPESIPQSEDDPGDTAWVILNQRCDLIKGLHYEPTVTLARTTKMLAADATDKTRRSVTLHLVRTNGQFSWVVDLREVITIPKTALLDQAARQSLPDDITARGEFALACGQRFWRRPVPRHIVEAVQEPLVRKRKNKTWDRDFFRYVGEILVLEMDDLQTLAVYAVIDQHMSPAEETSLSRFFDSQVIPYLEDRSPGRISEDESRVVPDDQLTLAVAFRGYKLDLDYLSSGEDARRPHI